MGVQEDAGNLLLLLYQKLIKESKDTIGTQEILSETGWDGRRINHAYNYLNDLNLFKAEGFIGNTEGAQNFFIMRLYPGAINIIENQKEFKRQFGFEVNLLLIKFSWGAKEK